jgi:hypothetical protein
MNDEEIKNFLRGDNHSWDAFIGDTKDKLGMDNPGRQKSKYFDPHLRSNVVFENDLFIESFTNKDNQLIKKEYSDKNKKMWKIETFYEDTGHLESIFYLYYDKTETNFSKFLNIISFGRYKYNLIYNYQEIYYHLKRSTHYDYVDAFTEYHLFKIDEEKTYYENGKIESIKNYDFGIQYDSLHLLIVWQGLDKEQYYYYESKDCEEPMIKRIEYWKKGKTYKFSENYDKNGNISYSK